MKYYLRRIAFVTLGAFIVAGTTSLPAIADSGVKGAVSAQQQQSKRQVTGTVTDALDGSPIIGANIALKGTQTGVISDLDGNYSIPVNSTKDILVVSFIGYKTREVPVETSGIIDIKLTSDNEMLDEVVIVGSGTQKKVSVTGAISTVKGLELKAPSSSLTSSMAGKLAGVIVNTKSGEPGTASEFFIRGVSTFGGRATPLILLDDVEIATGDLDNIPAETIESFSILKDASATAIYGARGANGVMLITTKKGQENSKTRINITLENSFNKPMNFPEFVDGATWMEMYNEAELTRNKSIRQGRYSRQQIEGTRYGLNPYVYPDVNWGDLIFKDFATNQRANINISGGGQKVTYYMSLNVNHDTGLLDSPKYYSWNNNINNMGYNFQNNISVKVTSTTTIDLNMNTQIRNNRGPKNSVDDLFKMMLSSNPINFPAVFPAQEGDQHVKYGNSILTANYTRINPYAYMATTFKQVDSNMLHTTLKIKQNLDFVTKGLSANALVNFKNWSSSEYNRTIEPYYYRVKENSYDPKNPVSYELERLGTSGKQYIAESGITRSGDRTIFMQFQINYTRQFGKHNVGGMLMYMQRDFKKDVLPNRNQGFSGRFTYDYGQRYLLEFNFGYNGTERLAKGDRFEFFPAASLGWVVSNEAFFEPLRDKIDNLKLRASYGLVGSDETGTDFGHFLYLDKVELDNIKYSTGYDWQTTFGGPKISSYYVLDAGWERSKKLDVGLEMTLFRHWNITADYFYEKRSNILMQRKTWPSQLGYSATPWSNVGKVDNWGWEFSTNYHHSINKDLSMDFRGNFTYVENKYVYRDEPYTPYPWKRETGRPLNSTWGYIAEGLYQTEDEIKYGPKVELGSTAQVGDIKYCDLNGDGVINADDQGMISEYGGNPRIQYGFGLNINYKKFDLGVFFNGSAMRKIMLTGIHPFGESDYNIFKFVAKDYWTEANPNPNAAYPRLGLQKANSDNNVVPSTFWMRNGNFLRFKTLEIGYRFCRYGRIYVTGDNLAVFSPFKEWDPELEWYKYPLQRTFNIGLQLNF